MKTRTRSTSRTRSSSISAKTVSSPSLSKWLLVALVLLVTLRECQASWRSWWHEHDKLQMDLLESIHDPAHPLRDIRESETENLSLKGHLSALHAAGFQYCSLPKDSWLCQGEAYIEVLKKTPKYNISLTMSALPYGSSIYAEGNSYFAELLLTIVCNSDRIKIWKLDNLYSNSYLVHSLDNQVRMLLLNNDNIIFGNYGDHLEVLVLPILRATTPDLIIVGENNEGPGVYERYKVFEEHFSGSTHVSRYEGRNLPNSCKAGFTNCKQEVEGHTCFPGPLISYAEIFFREQLLAPLEARMKAKGGGGGGGG